MLVKMFASRQYSRLQPWIIFMCGSAGAGKGYTAQWLSRVGIFPLEQIVRVDPDHFKTLMPEWTNYLRENTANAAMLCHEESALIAELAQEAGMQQTQNMWVDSTLHDHRWWSQNLARILLGVPDTLMASLRAAPLPSHQDRSR